MLYLALLFVLFLVGLIYRLSRIGHREKGIPPGPLTTTILGNLLQLSSTALHVQLTDWAKQYGGLYTLKIGSGTLAILTDRRIVKDLIDSRASKSSQRPTSYVGNAITGSHHLLLMPYGSRWRIVRRLIHDCFMERMVEEHHLHIQEAEASQLIRDIMLDSPNFMKHPLRFSNSITMSTVWGIRTPSLNTPHLQRLHHVVEIWSAIMKGGATPPVDLFPWIQYLPQSLFGNWKDRVNCVRDEMNSFYADLLRNIRLRRNVEKRGSFMEHVLAKLENENGEIDGLRFSEQEIWFMGGTLTEAGSDTSASVILAFIHAMAAHPEIQHKAQQEIDDVLGVERSPTWQDRADLPYVMQCVKETMRFRPVSPLGMPHVLSEDVDVDQWTIKKGTAIIINAWGMHHDEKTYDKPEVFDPDHFGGVTDLATELANGPYELRDHYGYGSGRRSCPGIHLAERNLFLAMAKLLWAFDIVPGKDSDGKTVEPDMNPLTGYQDGPLWAVKPFPAEFRVRGAQREQAILREFQACRSSFEPLELSEVGKK